ncbi:MAG: hypothetical protein K0Q79_1818 [Flavipsychrobacter sp.]|jgi:hypothetical protein|nr:hypothetical protein [Flavipsychrobacter sp.]
MKKLSVLFVLLLIAAASQSFAQNAQIRPTVTLGNIQPKTSVTGKPELIATREEILANPTLMMPPPPCEILNFQVSILPKGKDFQGPYTVQGPHLPPNVIDYIKGLEDPQGRIFIENINVKCGGQELHASPIIMKMVLKQ